MAPIKHHRFSPSRILVPVDFSAPSDAALQAATELAHQYGAAMHLLHVLPMLPVVAMVDSPVMFFPEQEFLEDAREDALKRLEALVAGLGAQGLAATCCVEIGNDVVGNILSVLEREHADVIVLSTHGTGGWRPAVFGSIADQVVKQVRCPLLLLHAEDPAQKAA